MTELAVGTAGHVDHGKTELVRALTGVDGDRLEAERRRGMTIVCGFAPWRLPGGREVSVVDVPGHERFVRTMATGVRSIDLGLLCIAVDDGVMPQTVEHAAILRLLGVNAVVVVVTKCDLDPGRAVLVGSAGTELARGLGLTAVAALPVSARTGLGLARLATTVASALDGVPPPADRGLPRLFADRCFTIDGVGTVVTGTLDGGTVRLGDAVEAVGSRARGRVLRLERRGRSVEAAEPGGRLAMALRGIPLAAVRRGTVIAPPGALDPTHAVDVLLDVPVAGASGLRHGSRVEVLHGTATLPAGVWLAGERAIGPGQQAYGQLRLGGPAAILPGDRILLRAPSPAATLAGGCVLDAHPPRHRRWSAAPLDGWSARHLAITGAGPEGPVGLAVVEASAAAVGIDARTAARRSGVSVAAAEAALGAAAATGRLVAAGSLWISPSRWERLVDRARGLVAAHAVAEPLAPGLARPALLRRLGLPAAEGDRVLARLQAVGALELQGGVARVPGAPPGAGRATPAVRATQALLDAAGLDAPGIDALRLVGATPRVLAYLQRTGTAVEVAPGVHLAGSAYAAAVDGVIAALRGDPDGLTVSELRQRLGTSRRVMVPLLERLGREGRTDRAGERHRLARARPALSSSVAGQPPGVRG